MDMDEVTVMDRRKCRPNRWRWFTVLALVGILCFILGMVIMRLALLKSERGYSTSDVRDRIQDEIKAENIRNNLRKATMKPHMAGTPADFETAEELRELWLRQGFDSAKLVPYNVLLQYPPDGEEERNKVQILEDGLLSFETSSEVQSFREEVLEQEGISPAFHAYSGNGDVMGDLVYVNYGHVDDYRLLQTDLTEGINFTGKIVICRSGLLLTDMVKNAETMGVVAVITYPDPIDIHSQPDMDAAYPNGPHLPRNATVMGSIISAIGDPLTPGYPATDGAFRVPRSSTKFPKIPVHPISFGDAEFIMSQMTGPSPPQHWRGLLNVSYQVGPGFKDITRNRKIRVYVNSTLKRVTTYNVIGFIRGAVEPDRYVIIGNHRDAWTLGAVDPTGGTAVMMEISRVFGMLKQEGWRPRRTIMFASWGAEEFALIGSVEWTEQYSAILSKRALAYLNLDVAVAGDYVLLPSYSALLGNVVMQTIKRVQDPDPEVRQTLYDSMKEKYGNKPEDVSLWVTGGTDFEAFIYGLGVSVFSAYYAANWNEQTSFYSLYHTAYETFRLVDEYIDRGFLRHRAMGQLFSEMLLDIADSTIINADITYYTDLLFALSENFRDMYMEDILNNTVRNISVGYLSEALDEFEKAAENFQYTILPSIDHDNPLLVRAINDQMMYLEQAFISRDRIVPDPLYRHTLFASALVMDSVKRTFPGIMVAMEGIDSDPDQEARWAEVEKQLSIVTHAMRSATSAIEGFISW